MGRSTNKKPLINTDETEVNAKRNKQNKHHSLHLNLHSVRLNESQTKWYKGLCNSYIAIFGGGKFKLYMTTSSQM